jgi:hypothetical protein
LANFIGSTGVFILRGLYTNDQYLGWINLLVPSHDQEETIIHL